MKSGMSEFLCAELKVNMGSLVRESHLCHLYSLASTDAMPINKGWYLLNKDTFYPKRCLLYFHTTLDHVLVIYKYM